MCLANLHIFVYDSLVYMQLNINYNLTLALI